MSGKKAKDTMKTVGFRLDSGSVQTLEDLAEEKGLNVSDFMRAVVLKVLAPVKDERDAQMAAIEALPPGAKEKALRAVEIQSRLRELKAERPKLHALSYLFQDGAEAVHDAETLRLENELASLKRAFEAEVVGPPPPAKKESKKPAPKVYQVSPPSEDEDELECPKCHRMIDASEAQVEDGGPAEIVCECGAVLEISEAEDEDEDEDEDGAPVEDPDEEKTAAEEEADRFLEITGLINSLRGCREKRSILDDFLGGPPACDLLIKELEAARGGAVLDEGRFEELRDMAAQAVKLRKKIAELEAADAGASGPTIKKLAAELEAMAAGLRDAAAKKKKAEKGSGSSSWF